MLLSGLPALWCTIMNRFSCLISLGVGMGVYVSSARVPLLADVIPLAEKEVHIKTWLLMCGLEVHGDAMVATQWSNRVGSSTGSGRQLGWSLRSLQGAPVKPDKGQQPVLGDGHG